MTTAVILDAVRTARGKRKGSLCGIHPVDLAAQVLRAALQRTGIPPETLDDVVLGCVTQVGEQGLNVARGAVLAAGLPVGLAAKTVNRLCGSGLQAVDDVACEAAENSSSWPRVRCHSDATSSAESPCGTRPGNWAASPGLVGPSPPR